MEPKFNIVLVEENMTLCRMLAFALESEFGATVYEAADADHAIEFLSIVPDANLIILGDAEKSGDLLQFLVAGNFPTILGVNDKLSDPNLLFNVGVLGVAQRKTFAQDAARLIRNRFFKGEAALQMPTSDFCRVRPQLLLMVAPLPCDVFVRISDQKYVRIFKQGDRFEPADFEKYTKQNQIDHFHISRQACDLFMKQLHAVSQRLLEGPVTPSKLREVTASIQSTVLDLVQKFGVTSEVCEMTRTNVELILKTVGSAPQLSDVYRRIHQEADQYIIKHGLAIAEISCVLAANVSWQSDVTFRKLILASLFHDITIKNNDIAELHSLEDASGHPELFLQETVEDFRLHPVKCAEVTDLLDDVPADVGTIILQHHEKPDGSGFPMGLLGHQIAPLSCLWIIAHHYVDYTLHEGKGADFGAFLSRFGNQYQTGNFKPLIKALQEKITI